MNFFTEMSLELAEVLIIGFHLSENLLNDPQSPF